MSTRILKEYITRILSEVDTVAAAPGAVVASEPERIGYISAYIPGDRRYGEKLEVFVDPTSRTAHIKVSETGAVGGMDSFHGTTEPYVTFQTKCQADASSILKSIKTAISGNGSLIKRYGKPTRNFRWGFRGEFVGLSASVIKQAIDQALTPDAL